MKTRSDFTDLTGQRFGRLLVLRPHRISSREIGFWCRCECGTEEYRASGNLRRPAKFLKSCGCGAKEVQILSHRTHGQSGSAEYGVFQTIKQRCNNPNSEKYENYGAVGIECRFRDFEHFFAVLGRRPSSRHSVDRINTFGHYCEGNVRWATPSEQQRNKRTRTASMSILDYAAFVAAPLSFGA